MSCEWLKTIYISKGIKVPEIQNRKLKRENIFVNGREAPQTINWRQKIS